MRKFMLLALFEFLIIWIVTFLIVLPLACNNTKTSLYYNTTWRVDSLAIQQELTRENDKRKGEALRYLAKMKPDTTRTEFGRGQFGTNSSVAQIELMIVTQSRNRIGMKLHQYQPYYLTQAVVKWLELISTAKEFTSKYGLRFSICNVDEDPQTYYEAMKLSKHVPIFDRFMKKTQFKLNQASTSKRKLKEKEDYIFCHSKLLEHQPDYLLVAEDDALPHADFFVVLQYILDTHIHRSYSRGELSTRDHVAWVKLYHPDYFSAFVAYEIERVPEWIALSLVLGTVSFFMIKRIRKLTGYLHLLWFLCVIYFLCLVLAIGRPSVMNLRHFLSPYFYAYYPSPGCCLPGMLYTASGIERAIVYMQNTMKLHKKYAKDQVLDKFMSDPSTKMTRYMVQPNLLTHIGMISGVRAKFDITRVD